jgi:hypothetical protein
VPGHAVWAPLGATPAEARRKCGAAQTDAGARASSPSSQLLRGVLHLAPSATRSDPTQISRIRGKRRSWIHVWRVAVYAPDCAGMSSLCACTQHAPRTPPQVNGVSLGIYRNIFVNIHPSSPPAVTAIASQLEVTVARDLGLPCASSRFTAPNTNRRRRGTRCSTIR